MRGIEDSEDGQDTAPTKPPLTEDVIFTVLESRPSGFTHVRLREKIIELGYSREEFEDLFKTMQKHPNITKTKSGKSLVLYKYKKSE